MALFHSTSEIFKLMKNTKHCRVTTDRTGETGQYLWSGNTLWKKTSIFFRFSWLGLSPESSCKSTLHKKQGNILLTILCCCNFASQSFEKLIYSPQLYHIFDYSSSSCIFIMLLKKLPKLSQNAKHFFLLL